MGALSWYYFLPYNPNVVQALHFLRKREFDAGRYFPAMPILDFPINPRSPSPGPSHASIEQAMRAAGETGTRSIIDMTAINSHRGRGILVELSTNKLFELYGSRFPTHEMVEQNMDFFTQIDRGEGVFFTVYEGDTPLELFFAGYSYD